MTQKIKFYIIASTGVIVLLVGLINFFASYGDATFTGIVQQVTAIIIVLGGVVNLFVAANIKKDIDKTEAYQQGRDHSHSARK